MEKTVILNLRVDPNVKKQAEEVLSKLGIPMSTAIDMYLNQISLTGGIPFPITLPKAPASVNADIMIDDELYTKLLQGVKDAYSGKTQNAEAAFQNFREINF
ncbi:type II toxin-antitoxin system RelB/DinJ family antitoxin [Tannockella kyphosi]|uniref:type II toxin-antitoxin system RelB/DinJ family antitoxin n=1 Tax=Tannockella kyphosi TaxID=2899121 RepID=UPI002010D727|nr:type II toxin-antitoxin system RelB/DinJ family antitoxin [Tannockella kyphosi]